jgi:hypothetical protein
MIESLILLAAIILAARFEINARKWGAPAAPSLPWHRTIIVDALRKNQPTNGPMNIGELGSGWGGLVAALSRGFPNAKIIGYEGYGLAATISRIRFMFHKNVTVKQADFFKTDLSGHNVVVCYLLRAQLAQLAPKLFAELPVGSIIITASFPLEGYKEIDHIVIKRLVDLHVFVYQKD